jgi:hypothetical protein
MRIRANGIDGWAERICTEKRACVYEYRVNSRVNGDTEAIVSCHVDEWSAMRRSRGIVADEASPRVIFLRSS